MNNLNYEHIGLYPNRRYTKSFLFGLVGIDYDLSDRTLIDQGFNLFVKIWFFNYIFVIKNKCSDPGVLYQKKSFEDVEIQPYVYPRSDFKVTENWSERGYFTKEGYP